MCNLSLVQLLYAATSTANSMTCLSCFAWRARSLQQTTFSWYRLHVAEPNKGHRAISWIAGCTVSKL
jgi:hypothetical protein